MTRLAGKVAIVTGASPNIGGALARGLAAQGARLLCTDLSEEVADTCARSIRDAGGEALALGGDVTDPQHAEDAVGAAVDQWGHVDVLVNNAVYFHQRGLLDFALEEYRHQSDVILTGAFLFTRATARAMIEHGHGGSIINVLSGAALQGQPGNLGYSTGKAGLLNFTRSVAMELAEHRIRVNGFTPTATVPDDPQVAAAMSELSAGGGYTNNFAGMFPWHRLPGPEDYVGAVVFLASDESEMVTGSNINVDGGASAKYWPWVPRDS